MKNTNLRVGIFLAPQCWSPSALPLNEYCWLFTISENISQAIISMSILISMALTDFSAAIVIVILLKDCRNVK